MKPTNQIDIWNYVEMALRRKWLIIIPFILITGLGVIYSQLPPDVYQANTLILVEPQKVPEAYIQSTVTAPINERLRTIREQIMSRTMLERIIEEFNLYEEKRKSFTMEEIVGQMRRDVNLTVRGRDSFSLSYRGKEARTVAAVANKLASLFIEENLRTRERLAEGTTEFLEMELDRIRRELESKERAIRVFKQKNLGELPGQLDANLRVLDRLQLQIQTNGEALRAAEDRKVFLQKQLADAEPTLVANIEREGANTTFSSPKARLLQLKQNLQDLQVKYTGKHPEVVKINKEIQELEAKFSLKQDGENSESASSIDFSSVNPLYQTLNNQMANLNLDIRRMKEEDSRLKKDIKKYQRRVENIPDREQELITLTRDYDNVRRNYQSLLNKKLEAQLATNMERKQKGEQFKILDPARIPEKPFEPNRLKMALIGMVLGLGIGGGLAFITEYLDNSFKDPKALEEFAKMPVIASVPKIFTEREISRKKIKRRIAFASSLGVLVVVIATVTIHFFVFRLDFLLIELSDVREILLPQ